MQQCKHKDCNRLASSHGYCYEHKHLAKIVHICESMYKQLETDSERLDEVVKECVELEEKVEPLKKQLNDLWLIYISLQDHWLVKLGFKFGLIKRRNN